MDILQNDNDKQLNSMGLAEALKGFSELFDDLKIGEYPMKQAGKITDDKRFALVLSGGGSRGAYEVGAWKALIDAGIEITAVMGTSVGAINGALVAQGDLDKAACAWCSMKSENMYDTDKPGLEKYRDTTKLKNLLDEFIDEEKVRRSNVTYGIVTYNLSEMKPVIMFTEDIPKGKLNDYIMASANHPAFERAEIDGDIFIDGGIFNNLPIGPLYDKGYRNFIVVDIRDLLGQAYRYVQANDINIIMIKHDKPLGSVLEFDDVMLKKRFRMGYIDAKRAVVGYASKIFAVNCPKANEKQCLTKQDIELLMNDPLCKELIQDEKALKKILYYVNSFAKISSKLSVFDDEFFLHCAEILAELIGFDDDREYDYKEFFRLIRQTLISAEGECAKSKTLSEAIWQKLRNIPFPLDESDVLPAFWVIISKGIEKSAIADGILKAMPKLGVCYITAKVLMNRDSDSF